MTDKDWDAIPYADGDCVRDESEWNDMVDYIRHSACTDFTIYQTCPSTDQAFRFTWSTTFAHIYGGANTGEDMMISANDADTYPSIMLFGNSDIWLDTADDIKFKQSGTEFLNIGYAAGITTIEGGAVAGDDLKVKGSSANTFPYIWLPGNSDIQMRTINNIYIYKGNVAYLKLGEAGTDDIVEGLTAGNDLYLKPVGELKWGVETTNAGSDRGKLIKMKTAAGDTVYLKTYDLV